MVDTSQHLNYFRFYFGTGNLFLLLPVNVVLHTKQHSSKHYLKYPAHRGTVWSLGFVSARCFPLMSPQRCHHLFLIIGDEEENCISYPAKVVESDGP